MRMLDRFKLGKSMDYDKTCFHSVEKNVIILKEQNSNAKTANTLTSKLFINLRSNLSLNLGIWKAIYSKKNIKKNKIIIKPSKIYRKRPWST